MTWTEQSRGAAVEAGEAVLTRHECRRCHLVDDLPEPPREDNCTSCHLWLDGLEPGSEHYVSISEKYGEEVLLRYQDKIEHLKVLPDLSGIGGRVRPDWIEGFLAAPEDIRPHLEESMIRTRLSPEERRILGDYFAAVANVERAPTVTAPPVPDMEAGAALYEAKGCGGCHFVGNIGDPGRSPLSAMAPNLRFVRQRMTPEAAAAWIQDPQAMSPGALMPGLGLTRAEAELLRDWLWHVDPELEPTPPEPLTVMTSAVEREVTWAEVDEAVFGHICVHCHMNDHEKDPGPGNEGGLGYDGVDLSMRTYDELRRGYLEDGERVPLTEGLVDSMMLRHVEARRDHLAPGEDRERPPYSAALGMPLGLPAIPLADIMLVQAWIDQGCPGPTETSGLEGVTDGYLVPDGPSDLPGGCGLSE